MMKLNRAVGWFRTYMGDTLIRREQKQIPEQMLFQEEIMEFLVKRETSLADALDALTMVMLHPLVAKYGKRDEFSHFFELVRRFPTSTERDRAVGVIPIEAARQFGGEKFEPRTVTMVERPEGIDRLASEVAQIINDCKPRSLGDGLNALSSTMFTAIEATCGRERANEFDLLMAGFSKDVIQKFSGGRVQ